MPPPKRPPLRVPSHREVCSETRRADLSRLIVPSGTPPAEVTIDEERVRALLRDQHPDLAEQTLTVVESGWDNAMFRLGEDLAVRLPQREIAGPLIVHEQKWLPELAARLSLSLPVPIRTGVPGQGYPFRWSVIPWLAGDPADRAAAKASEALAWADFLMALHLAAPEKAPRNPFRGVPLRDRRNSVDERFELLTRQPGVLPPEIPGLWERALSAPSVCEPVWLHGDLHPRNVLVEGGRVSGVIDWGDLCAGDPATDLASVWMLFDDEEARARCLARYGAEKDLLLRAKGWAVFFGVMLASLSDDSRHAATGRATLGRLAADAG